MKERARGQFDHGVKSMKGGGAIGRVPNRIMEYIYLYVNIYIFQAYFSGNSWYVNSQDFIT